MRAIVAALAVTPLFLAGCGQSDKSRGLAEYAEAVTA